VPKKILYGLVFWHFSPPPLCFGNNLAFIDLDLYTVLLSPIKRVPKYSTFCQNIQPFYP